MIDYVVLCLLGMAGLDVALTYLAFYPDVKTLRERKQILDNPDRMGVYLNPLESEFKKLTGRKPTRPSIRNWWQLEDYENLLKARISDENPRRL